MPRLFVYGLAAPLVAASCFLACVLATTMIGTGDIAASFSQWWRYVTQSPLPARLVMFAPAALLGLCALPVHRRARKRDRAASRNVWTIGALALFALPHLVLGLIIMQPGAALVSGLLSGAAALLLVSSLYPAERPAVTATSRKAVAPPPAGSRTEFGLRRR
jgi:hypothetical protein